MPAESGSSARWRRGALPRLVVAVLAGAVVVVVRGLVGGGADVMAGIATTATLFTVTGWVALYPMSAESTRTHTRSEALDPLVDELLVVAASVIALIGVFTLLVDHGGSATNADVILSVVAVVMSWAALHLMYAARYATLYYDDEPSRGIDFNAEHGEQPAFRDFFYFSYNLGMTYQVSDTDVTSSRVRRVVLRHCLISYVFGAAIIATTINLVVGVLSD